MDQRNVREFRHGPAEGAVELVLAKGIGQMIVAADHVGDAHVMVVHHDRQHVSRRSVGAQQHHVVELRIGDRHLALDAGRE